MHIREEGKEQGLKIAVVGGGYVGLSNAVMFAQSYETWVLDIDARKVDAINNRISPVEDADIDRYLVRNDIDIKATLNPDLAYENADYILIATPTDYDPINESFNTLSVESVIISAQKIAPEATIVIKSTLPIGFTQQLADATGISNILFVPEFLREGHALSDCLNPSRIIIGAPKSNPVVSGEMGNLRQENRVRAEAFLRLVLTVTESSQAPSMITHSTEAEAVKLFSNCYLAMRVAFFNELDTYAELMDLESKQIIDGISLDPRIGNFYNNPSFGYGGYCLPKDTKQLSSNYRTVPNKLIRAIVESNVVRKDFITEQILSRNPKTIGVYKLAMKNGSDNIRQASTISIINRAKEKGIEVIIYEPLLSDAVFQGSAVIEDLAEFKEAADIIIANRYDSALSDSMDKLYTRDIFNEN
ncbi:MAG: nucleotide sugar dehydrogenase [Coriobacteriales bacterium]|jgi:UDPglucose 6-dehydrogenase|nr:nucleotide sugar dehydrogenase [Coriobacteriales bacterium]